MTVKAGDRMEEVTVKVVSINFKKFFTLKNRDPCFPWDIKVVSVRHSRAEANDFS